MQEEPNDKVPKQDTPRSNLRDVPKDNPPPQQDTRDGASAHLCTLYNGIINCATSPWYVVEPLNPPPTDRVPVVAPGTYVPGPIPPVRPAPPPAPRTNCDIYPSSCLPPPPEPEPEPEHSLDIERVFLCTYGSILNC